MRNLVWKDMDDAARRECLRRPAALASVEAERVVRDIFADVRSEGDAAVRRYAKKFDGFDPDPPQVPESEIARSGKTLPPDLRQAIDAAYSHIRAFHSHQGYRPYQIEVMAGLVCRRLVVPIEKVGLYIPGGTAPLLSTALMLGVPSQLAGNPSRILCTPPDRSGNVSPAILYAAGLCGINRVFRLGGAQAVAAMAIGTPSIDAVDKIFGPGNLYVTLAKEMAAATAGGPAIDMRAGPSEVLVIASSDTPAAAAAADLLAQAEHDRLAQVVLVSDDRAKVAAIMAEADIQLSTLPRRSIASAALENAVAIIAESLEQAMEISNAYAPEHLVLCFVEAEKYLPLVKNAGSVFCGTMTPESLGDYASGTNHVLPTSAAARAYSGLSVEAFQKTVTAQTANAEGLRGIGGAVVALSRSEGLEGHARAVIVRG